MAAAEETGVDLGFVEECSAWKLKSKFFPSKVGGKPAWLNFKDLPKQTELLCDNCKKPCLFLLQVYAPIDDVASCFHRTIYVFVCKDPKCCSRNSNSNFKVFRNQLPRENEIYSSEPPVEDENDPSPKCEDFNTLCVVCGCLASLRCSKCRKMYYCSAVHQTVDWKAGHKEACNPEMDQLLSFGSSSYLLKEFELVTEPEPVEEKELEKDEQEVMRDYLQFLTTEKAKSMIEESGEVLEKEIGDLARKEDKQYNKFIQRIKRERSQVLRHKRGGEPLWVSAENIPTNQDIPLCPCGASRRFEFQVLPQLLNHLQMDRLDDSIDWGTLAVYTCSQHCNSDAAYHPEFLWKQDFSFNEQKSQ